MNANVGYVYSQALVEQLNKIPKIAGRAQMVNSLLNSYDLFSKLKVILAQPCDAKLLQTFHSATYLEYLQRCDNGEDSENLDESLYGLDHDCPIVDNLFQLCTHIGGASLTAATLLASMEYRYAINWCGGWHHAKRERASGYCYVNDCVLAILRLRKKFERVLYLDLDLHHGDGVQEAFEYTNKVLTLSFHKCSPGFFPGTGNLNEVGKGPGLYYTVNIPLQSGVDDQMFTDLFTNIFKKVIDNYRPEAIVTQCGADGLYGDPIDSEYPFNLTLDGYLKCIKLVMDTKLPCLFLGGGGYNFANTSRLWSSIVGLLVNQDLQPDIPDNDPYFLEYAPSYELSIERGCHRNKNTDEYAQEILNTILHNLENIKI